MKVFELSKEFGVTNKEIIDFLKSKNFKVSSHSQNLTDEMIEVTRKDFAPAKEEVVEEPQEEKKEKKKPVLPVREIKKFAPDDPIPCRSLVPWRMTMLGLDKVTPYKWSAYGDVEYVAYRDLQSWRRKSIIRQGKIFIENSDICEMWKHDLEGVYKNYVGVDYPEEFFDKSDAEFEAMLRDSSDTFREVIKFTAIDMIRNENYPSIQKITIIDKLLGTGILEFVK